MPLTSLIPESILGHPQGKSRTHPVPKAQPAQSRPPKSLRDHVPLYGKLPHYSGPYTVGVLDIEIPAKNPRQFSDIIRDGVHIIELETVLLSVYYPAHLGTGSGPSPTGARRWSRPTWLTRPRPKTSSGYARYAGLPAWPTMGWFLATSWLTKLPAYSNARIAGHWPPLDSKRQPSATVKDMSAEPPKGEPTEPVFPLIMFSHGLGGTRTAYSSVCGEFASYGFVVCAVEHRDGSAPRTLVNHTAKGIGSREEREKTGHLDHKRASKKQYDLVDFIIPKYDKNDVIPGHQVDRALRTAQIELRLAELEEAYRVMSMICSGQGEEIAKQNLRLKGALGGSSHGLKGVDWSSWKGRFHTSEVTMVGHSFGSATAIEVLRHKDRFQYVTQGIIYDIWGMGVNPPEDNPQHRIQIPVLGINSEAFMYWPENFNVAKSICNEARDHGTLSWLMTVRGTVHISQSDFCILYPYLASWGMKTYMLPTRAIDLNINASLEFLSRVLPLENKPFHRCLDTKKLLDLPCLQEMPHDHEPNKKWMAMRLKIEHEARMRVVPNHKKKYWEARQREGEEEVWIHLAPNDEELQMFECVKCDVGGENLKRRTTTNSNLDIEKRGSIPH